MSHHPDPRTLDWALGVLAITLLAISAAAPPVEGGGVVLVPAAQIGISIIVERGTGRDR